MVKNGLDKNWTVKKVWLNKINGNGVYLAYNHGVKKFDIIVVYNEGFMTDFIVSYYELNTSQPYGGNINHSKTTHKAILKACKELEKIR